MRIHCRDKLNRRNIRNVRFINAIKYRGEIMDFEVRRIPQDPCDIYGFKCLGGFVRGNTERALESES